MPNITVRRRFSLIAALPLLLLTGCGSGNPDSMVGKDINMNAIVDANAVADTNAEDAQYPQASNVTEVPSVKERSTAPRAADNSADTTSQSDHATPSYSADEPPATDSNSQ